MQIWASGARNKIFAVAITLGFLALAAAVVAQVKKGSKDVPVPIYKVDPFWPKPLPNKWILQGIPVMVTDKDDHIWVISRPGDIKPDESGASTNPPRTDCCIAAPAVVEFDTEGNLLKAWGGPGYSPGWPKPNEHAILVDREGNVWISSGGRGNGIEKFTGDGKFLWDFGHRAPPLPQGQPNRENNQQTDILQGGVFEFTLDEDAQEIYLIEQKRVLVYGYDGSFKRGWGGKGKPLSSISNDPTPPYDWRAGPPPDQEEFAPALHCVHISVDGLVYVCERGSDRVQAFTKQGKFVTSYYVHPSTIARGSECGGPGSTMFGMCGTIYNLSFSHDALQKYILIADGTNDKVWIQDRMTGAVAGSVGDNGRMAGYFHWIDAIAVDSLGNMYTGEVDTGKRIQKFMLMNGDKVKRPHPHD
jgi:hypothetical protein